MYMSRCEDIVLNKEGKLLTNQTTVIVDTTIRKTTLVRAAEHVDVAETRRLTVIERISDIEGRFLPPGPM
jgi:hypothetical protein